MIINSEYKNNETYESIINLEYRGWSDEICFLLVTLYEKAILNRGSLYFDTPIGEYNCAWLEIFYNNKWYVFDPSNNIICEKEIFNKTFNAKVVCSFTSDEVKSKLINNLYFSDIITYDESKSKLKILIKNQISQLVANNGIILPSYNINDLTYGANFQYTLKKSKNEISLLKASYLSKKYIML